MKTKEDNILENLQTILKPGGKVIEGVNWRNCAKVLAQAIKTPELNVFICVSKVEQAPEDELDTLAGLLDESDVQSIKHKPYDLKLSNGSRIIVRVYDENISFRGLQPDIILYENERIY